MAEKLLTVLIVNFNSSEFVELSLKALKILTKNSYDVFIMDNNSAEKDYKNLTKISKKFPGTSVLRNETQLVGSMAHGTALNDLVRLVKTPYFCILDADATWLIKGWDEILIKRINDDMKVIGTQAPVGSPKPQDFPLMFAILFETKTFNQMQIDFRPGDLRQYQDTGYQIRERYLASSLKGELISMKNTRSFRKGPFKDIVCAEYYLTGTDEIFASHFGRGSNPFGKSNIKTSIPGLGLFLTPINYLLWKRDKRRWISKCEEIINDQIEK